MSAAHDLDGLSAALAARSVTVSYRSDPPRTVLSNVDIDIRAGELAAIVGPNGSGKSTLVQALSRVLRPDGGVVLLNGADLYRSLSAREAACAIGVAPQSTDVFLDFTVRDIVAMGRAPRRASRGLLAPDSPDDDRAVAQALNRMQLGADLAQRPIGQVSGGERQRALIARMLAQEAQVLLLDEPTAALDLSAQAQLLSWLRRLAKLEGAAVVVVLHDLNTAAEYADRIIVLDHGRTVAQGRPFEVLTAETIERVYGVRTWVRANPLSGRPLILRIDSDESDLRRRVFTGRRIHVFCGAGFGAKIMFRLSAFGADISASLLLRGDADDEAAGSLGARAVAIEPFGALTSSGGAEAEALSGEAEAAVFCRTPIGEVNRSIVRCAESLVRGGKPVVALSRPDSVDIGELATAGAVVWADDEDSVLVSLAAALSEGGRVA